MNVLADTLTALRCVFVLVILYTGVVERPAEGLPTAAVLTILAWITDVLDGMLARRANRPTHLGLYDPVADVGLTIAISVCLVAWGILPSLLVAGGLALAGVSARRFRAMAPMHLAMGVIYSAFILAVWGLDPEWGHTLVGGVVLVALLNPQRARQQVTGFLNQVGTILKLDSSQTTRAGVEAERQFPGQDRNGAGKITGY